MLAEKVRWGWAFWIIAPRESRVARVALIAVAAFTMLLIQFTVPQKELDGDYKDKTKNMDWLGGLLSLTMTVCLLVNRVRLRGPLG